ncbi:helix-turn-helix domain-containing protein [Brucella sp. HL-2]|nr:helix-turn-helix domain-containing protein [Brucella sp. HL-2]MCV9908349.1 helix-turn-helix domain-containing protein [Brucella sp. HL-2]
MKEEATIRRGARNARYAAIPNHVFEEVRLSMEARWLLGYLLSKPDNWTVVLRDIINKGNCGRDKARRMIAELVELGYAQKEQARDSGRFSALSLVIYDEPFAPVVSESVASLPQTENPSTVNPSTEKPAPVNPPLVITDNLEKPDYRSERGASAIDQEDRKKIELAYWKLVRSWPKLNGTPQAKWFDTWLALTPEERIQAAEKRDAWVELLRSNGRDHIHVPGTYFENKLWEQVPDAPAPSSDQPARLEAKPFGKLFGVEVYRNFLTVSPGMISAPTAFERGQIQRGERSEQEIYREKLVKQGWGSVEGMFERAATGRSTAVSARFSPLCEQMESVRVGGEQWLAWQAYHAERGWRWYPAPDWLEWVCFPVGGPDGMKDFETALRGIGDDDGR